MNAERIGRSD